MNLSHQPLIIVVASGNRNKVAEIGEIMAPVSVVTFDDIFGYPHHAVEDGLTFAENAIKKIDFLPLRPDTVYLSDDSGLVVDALDGRPGIYSARYGGEGVSTTRQCELILESLNGTQNRTARFVAVIALRFPNGNIETVEGIVEGTIAFEIKGNNGFGYDPIFIPEGETRTFGEMTASEKHGVSHRARALGLAKPRIDSYIR
ncbi:RdgB/HAM1 family non-canonical purine NTP pyrophosphatase [bacterium]|nr:RdgB/HAM1 family non-canonical purine NTP pyrophosphatase [bacterium]